MSSFKSGAKPWEHVWSIDEMRKSASSWCLASDVGMLLHLQDFSQRLLAKTHDIQEQLDATLHEAKLTGVRVNNVFNDFITLANTQFVENRVYDEDVSAEATVKEADKKDDKERTKEEREVELIARIKEAVNHGLNVLDTAYDKLDMNVGDSDSEDEGTSAKAVAFEYEPKDPYIHRPLPYLIGSDEFERNDDVGLSSETPDDDEVIVEPPPSAQTPVPVASVTPKTSGPAFQHDDSSSEDNDDLFGEVSSTQTKQTTSGAATGDSQRKNSSSTFGNDDETNAESSSVQKAQNFSSELSARLNARQPDTAADSTPGKQDTKQEQSITKTKRRSNDMFSLPVDGADSDDESDIFRKPAGLFTSHRSKLFGDDDQQEEDGGLFGGVPQKSASVPTDRVTDVVASVSSEASASKPVSSDSKPVIQQKGLFEDDEEDLFAAATQPKSTHVKESKPASGNLFGGGGDDEEADDDDFFKPTTSKKPTQHKVPAGAVPVFSIAGDEQFKAALAKSKTLQGDNEQVVDDGDEKFKPSAVKSLLVNPSTTLRGGSASPSTQSSSSLFAEDPELFVSPTTTAKATAAATQPSVSKKKVTLFDDDEDDEGDLFSSMSAAPPAKTSAPTPEKAKVSKLVMENEDDLFGSAPKSQSASVATERKPTAATEVKPASKVMSLFDDDDEKDQEGDLFATKVKPKPADSKTAPPPTQQKTGTLSLFGDDMLFTSSDDGPGVDLFGAIPSTQKKPPDVVASTSSSQAASVTSDVNVTKQNGNSAVSSSTNKSVADSKLKSSRVVDMFADDGESDSEEDLFAPTKPSKTADKKNNEVVQRSTTAAASDLFAAASKQSLVDSKDTVSAAGAAESTDRSFRAGPVVATKPAKQSQNDLFGTPVESSPVSSRKEPVGGKIAQLQSSLSINPVALLPAKEKEYQEPQIANFDAPMEVRTLQSVVKDRVRVQAKRRPPTRKTLNAHESSDDLFNNVVSETSSHVPKVADSAVPELEHSKSTNRVDSSLQTTVAKDVKQSPPSLPVDVDTGVLPVLKEAGKLNLDTNFIAAKTAPIVSDVSNQPSGNLITAAAAAAAVASTGHTNLFDDDADDIFADSSVKSKVAVKPLNTKALKSDDISDIIGEKPTVTSSKSEQKVWATKKPVLDDEDEDIFADSLLRSGSKIAPSKVQDDNKLGLKTETKTKPVTGIFDDDDDDIFAVKPKPASALQQVSTTTVTAAKRVTEDDDLFGTSLPVTATRPVTSSTRKKYATRDEDLFADDTDIFADVSLASKSKASTTTKSKKPSPEDDDQDDIFSDMAPKSTVTKSSKAAVKTVTKTDDIFDDPLNAFSK